MHKRLLDNEAREMTRATHMVIKDRCDIMEEDYFFFFYSSLVVYRTCLGSLLLSCYLHTNSQPEEFVASLQAILTFTAVK